MSRPEQLAPPEIFYNDTEAVKYTSSTRVQHIQAKMTFRALELLNLEPSSQMLLDIGCGSGLSGEILTEEGYIWCGMDISPSMLATGLDREVDGDLFLADMGNGIPFRPGSFDAAISISAIQWLCNADTTNSDPQRRTLRFFNTLFASLKKGGKFVAQFYPMNDNQIDQILSCAKVAGFQGGLVIDDPDSKKNKKYYLVLSAGQSERQLNLQGLNMDAPMNKVGNNKKLKKKVESTKNYINRKKELMKKRGKVVAKDSKFTEKQLEKLDPTFWRRDLIKPSERNGGSILRPGDIVRVMYNTRNIPTFTGQIIKISKKNLDSNLLLRNLINKVGVELNVKLFNPLISRIDLVRKPNKYKLRNRQYYIRGNRLDVGDLDASLRKKK
ncbi:hypothetical protein WICMUC_001278 [Wickerhamomyces mucosus]|uniref:Methyltransferase type 11 domain-containing protein n=1 Tax=Wickerhamomyces mucosus TaxID=1378264 RepID=A0A9P8PVB8_9ASCO|nr:hypothetical protein WICMUC_001278 [Wickerhamomyces mucosus]